MLLSATYTDHVLKYEHNLLQRLEKMQMLAEGIRKFLTNIYFCSQIHE